MVASIISHLFIITQLIKYISEKKWCTLMQSSTLISNYVSLCDFAFGLSLKILYLMHASTTETL